MADEKKRLTLREIERAKELDIPLYYTIEDLTQSLEA